MPEAPSNPELDRLLVEMHVRLRQEQYGEVKERLAKAKALAPEHPAVLEIEGDLAFAQGRYKQAETLFKAALQADPGNARVEEKFATALLKVQMPGFSVNQIPDDVDSFWSNRVPRNPVISGVLSAILPGLGQFHNGDWAKGGVLLLVDLLVYSQIIYAVYKTLQAIKHQNLSLPYSEIVGRAMHSVNIFLLLLLAAALIYSVADAIIVARQTRQSSASWK
ncbi:MAG: tetratricopeptide repeat protein [Armatimonadota bacterium]